MLILVRHGETALNVERRLQGRRDESLTEHGRVQAAALGEYLGPIDAVITSPLLRATETAAHLQLVPGATIEVDERWIELDYGEHEGDRLDGRRGGVWERWYGDPSFTPTGGESLLTVAERVEQACGAAAARARTETVVVVSHVSPIKAAVAWAVGASVDVAWRTHLATASICRVAIDDRHPVLVTFNELPPALAAQRDDRRWRG